MVEEPLFVLNRMAVVVLPKGPFVEWVNRVECGEAEPLTLEQAREDPNAFLIPVRADEMDTSAERWLRLNWSMLFDRMLAEWYVDKSVWPRSRTRQMFQAWCEIREHSVVLDCSNEPLEYSDD